MPRKNPHPHVAWRDGRPRFSPGVELRAMGYKGKDLRHENGSWYSRGEAVDWSARFQLELEAARLAAKAPTGARASSRAPSGAKGRSPGSVRTRHYTVAQLLEDWRRSPRWRPDQPRSYSENTRRDYAQKISVLEADHELIWNAPVETVKRSTLRAAYEETWEKRGLASARGMIAVLSIAYSWGILRGKVKRETNPAQRLQMEVPAPRVRFATRKEFEALVKAADAMGRPELGDMFYLAVWTGQRQADRLALCHGPLINGRRMFRQGKTNAVVAIREAPELERRLAASETRRARARAEALLAASPKDREDVAARFSRVILDEAVDTRPGRGAQRWLPFGKYHYGHVFAEVRAAAVAGIVDEAATARAVKEHRRKQLNTPPPIVYAVSPCPSLADFKEADLRDTAVTWMALAESTVPEITAVTGHTDESATRILKHYLARHPEMADSAIGKMMSWYDRGGETEIGL